MSINVLQNQSFLDIAIQHTGSALNAFDIAYLNNMSVSSDLKPGITLGISGIIEVNKNKEVFNYYQLRKIQPATSLLSDLIVINPLEGIGYWEVENEFKVE